MEGREGLGEGKEGKAGEEGGMEKAVEKGKLGRIAPWLLGG